MFRLVIIFGIVLVVALVTIYIVVDISKRSKTKRTKTNNEYDNYPQD